MPATIDLSPSAVTLVSIGDTVRLSAVVKDEAGAELPTAVTWSAADSHIATVSAQGIVAAAGNGTTTIRATASSATGSAQVTVRQEPHQITLTPEEVTLRNPGDTAILVADVRDAGGAEIPGAPTAWVSADPSVATVSDNGTLTAVARGTTTITATSGSLMATASAQVIDAAEGLVYRWTFSEEGGAGTVFRDDIQGAEASIVHGGTLAASAVAGQVTLTGGDRGNADYVALPPGLLRGLGDATIEVWATVHSLKNWSRVFDIGSSAGNNLFVAWSQGTDANTDRTAFALGGVEDHLDNALAPFTIDLEHHIVVAVDEDSGPGGATSRQGLSGRRAARSVHHRLPPSVI